MQSPIIGTIIGERWRVTDLLGRGGFGQVFACHDESDISLGQAAVKLLHANTTPLERSEFLGEVKQMAQLRHQNLVGYLDSGLHQLGDDVHPFLVTERCEGSLDDHLAGDGPDGEGRGRVVDGAEAATILADVLDGLVHLHDRQLVHRDLKPANVLRGDGAWKLADFGLMRELTATGSYHRTDQVVGTPRFMAPELFTTGRATAASDVYAIGVLAHLLVTGRTVHQGSGPSLVHAVTSTPPVIDPTIPPAWSDWLAATLRADPAQRPTARQLRQAVATLLADPGQGVGADPLAPPPPGSTAPGSPTAGDPGSGGSATTWPAPVGPPTAVGAEGDSSTRVVDGPTDAPPVGDGPAAAPVAPAATTGPGPAGPAGAPDPAAVAPQPSRSGAGLLAAVGLVVVGLVGVAGWFALRGGGDDEPGAIAAIDAGTPDQDPVAGSDGAEDAKGDDAVQIGDGVAIGSGVEIGSASDGSDSDSGASNVSPPEAHVATPPCATGVSEQILITNPDDGHRDYRIHVHHRDAQGVRVDEHLVSLKGVAPGEMVSAGVVPREEGVVACDVETFSVTATNPASIEAVAQAELVGCVPDGGWYDVTLNVTNPTDRSVDAEVYVAMIGVDGVRLDEDWAGTSVYGIGPGETVRAEESHVFWNVDALGSPEVTCRIVAVEFE